MKIVMLSATFPYPPTRGGTQVRTFHLLKHLAQQHDVTLLTQAAEDVSAAEIDGLREQVKELVVFARPVERSTANPLGKVQRFVEFVGQGTPPNVQSLYSLEMQQWLDRAVASGQVDAITCEHSVNEIYVRPEWRQLRRVVNIHSSVYATCADQLASATSTHPWRDRLNLPLLKRYEQRYCQKFSAIVVTTDEDERQIAAFAPQTPIFTIPNGVDLERFPVRTREPDDRRIVFIGAMDNAPNIDAATFLATEVFPTIRDRCPDAKLDLVGARPVPSVAKLAELPGVSVTGAVPSMVEYLHRAMVCVVPMRTGFGIKNKTLEAMAAGVPVVGSDRGLEGLAVDVAGEPLRALRANRVEEYVAAIERLFGDRQLRQSLSQEGRRLIEQRYTWQRAGAAYEQVLNE